MHTPGIYLVNEANKSGWYVMPSSDGVGILLLVEARARDGMSCDTESAE